MDILADTNFFWALKPFVKVGFLGKVTSLWSFYLFSPIEILSIFESTVKLVYSYVHALMNFLSLNGRNNTSQVLGLS